MIEAHNLSKSFGALTALAGVDLHASQGETLTLVGPNGAGKTTLLRILATLVRPTAGSLRIAGLDPARAGESVRRLIGFLSHRTLVYDDLTAQQNLHFYARMYDVDDAPARIQELLRHVGLAMRQHDLVRTFSRGMQQRLSIARAVLHRPQILLLDEPFSGLDATATDVLTDLLQDLAGSGTAMVLTTHSLERGLALAQRVLVLARGTIVYDAPRADVSVATFPGLYQRLTS